MFNIEAFDVVIGLIFIYLLFSLFVSIINEMLSSLFQTRGKELKFSIERMVGQTIKDILYGNSEEHKNLYKNSKLDKTKYRSSLFYGTPLWRIYKAIRTLFSSEIDTKSNTMEKKITNQALPSNISRETFADALIDIVQDEELRKELFEQAPFLEKAYKKAGENINQFKEEIESWFDEIMTYTSEWYKQKLRYILVLLGFLIAVIFNVDTFSIVKTLSDNPQARATLVQQAEDFINSYENENGKIVLTNLEADTLVANDMVVTKEIEKIRTHYINTFSDTVKNYIKTNEFKGIDDEPDSAKKVLLIAQLDSTVSDSLHALANDSLAANYPNLVAIDAAYQDLNRLYKQQVQLANSTLGLGWNVNDYDTFWKAVKDQFKWYSIFGWLTTALALSLGAPFWFDLLKKVMNIKDELKKSNSGSKTTQN